MNAFDIVILIVVAFCLIRGLFRGLIKEVAGIIGVVAGFYGAFTYYAMAGSYLGQWIETVAYRNLLAFFLLFCLVFILVNLAAVLIRKLLKVVFLGWVDCLFGMVFGAAKGILIVTVLFIMLTTFVPDNAKFLSGSTFSPYAAEISRTVMVFVSKNFRTDFQSGLQKVQQVWKQ